MMSTSETKERDVSNQTRKAGSRRRWLIVLIVVCFAAVGGYLFFSRQQSRAAKQAQKPSAPTVPVVAVEAKKTDFNVYLTGLGSVTPVNTVTVRTRVDGQLM